MLAPRTGAWKVGFSQLLSSFKYLCLLVDVLPRLRAAAPSLEDPHRTAAGRDSALKHLPYPHNPKAKAAAIAGLPFARTILGSARDRHGNL